MHHFINEQFIAALAFIVFVPLVYKFAKKAILTILDDRTSNVIKSLQESERIYNEAQTLLNEAKAKYDEAEATIKLMIEQAENEAVLLIQEAKTQAENITKKKTELFLARISQQEKQLIEDVKNSAIQLAMDKVEESLITEIDRDTQLNLIEDGLKQAKKLMH